ncbi:hypothetical protein ABZ770_04160 [Streptomyces sp. NPDC006654]|uniref:hypothetical protein n=1 Tax=Streptomyces sp. NPDC006654 TaxID=3156897 RepID=UPI0033F56629
MIVLALLGPVVPLVMLLGLPVLEDRLFPPSPPLPEGTDPEQADEDSARTLSDAVGTPGPRDGPNPVDTTKG